MSHELSNLFPITKSHSIAEVIVTFHLGKKIDDAQEFVKKFKVEFPDFKEAGITFSQGIQLQIDKTYLPKINSNDPQIEGFFARKLQEDGTQSIVIQSSVDVITGIPSLSIHFLKYSRFSDFSEKLFEIMNKLGSMDVFILQTICLSYIDMFEWRSEKDLPIKKIFKKKSSFLSGHFFSYVGDFSFLSSGVVKRDNQREYIEKIRILSMRESETLASLQIIHDIVLDLKRQVLLNQLIEGGSDSEFNEIIKFQHELNKLFLGDLLLEKIKQKIKLNP